MVQEDLSSSSLDCLLHHQIHLQNTARLDLCLLLPPTDLLLAGLQQQAHEVRVVVGGEVRQPGAGVGVQGHLNSM